eukprot:Awhi_evm1s10967
MKKQAESIVNNQDMGAVTKAKALEAIHKKSRSKKPKEFQYVVAQKAGATKRPQRPSDVKGAYKMVDPRMKTDKRAKERAERRKKKGKKKRR